MFQLLERWTIGISKHAHLLTHSKNEAMATPRMTSGIYTREMKAHLIFYGVNKLTNSIHSSGIRL